MSRNLKLYIYLKTLVTVVVLVSSKQWGLLGTGHEKEISASRGGRDRGPLVIDKK